MPFMSQHYAMDNRNDTRIIPIWSELNIPIGYMMFSKDFRQLNFICSYWSDNILPPDNK